MKTRRFSKPKYVGDPINAIRIFNDKFVDELILLDIGASRNMSAPNYQLIEEIAGECFMPLCYGGGIKNEEQARILFSLGVEKISLQSAAFDDMKVISRISNRFGSQSVVVSVDIKRNFFGKRILHSYLGTHATVSSWREFIRLAVSAGAGEILLNSVDCDGEMKGMDTELIREISLDLEVPLIALGGVGSLRDIQLAIKSGASAVAAGSYFVFHGPHRAVLITYPNYHELEMLGIVNEDN